MLTRRPRSGQGPPLQVRSTHQLFRLGESDPARAGDSKSLTLERLARQQASTTVRLLHRGPTTVGPSVGMTGTSQPNGQSARCWIEGSGVPIPLRSPDFASLVRLR